MSSYFLPFLIFLYHIRKTVMLQEKYAKGLTLEK